MKKYMKLMGGGVVAAVAIALFSAPLAASAAPLAPTTSSHPVWLTKGTGTPALLAPEGSHGILDSVFAAKSANPADRLWEPDRPANAAYETEFISARGKEFAINDWSVYADQHVTAGNRINLAPGNFANANPGKSLDDIGRNGGEFSLGFAWVDANGAVLESNFVHIVVTGNADYTAATYTYSTPAAAPVTPAITTTALDAATVGTAFSQTIAATGSPTSWTVQSGALPAGLTLDASTGAITGTPTAAGAYTFTLRASNGAGSHDQAFTGSVNAPAPTAPTEPTGSAPAKVDIVDPAKGVNTVVVPAGQAYAGAILQAWAWSTPTNLGQVTADSSGNATVNIASLPAGTHTIALTQPGDATFTVLAWDSIVKQSVAGEPVADNVDIEATVTASDLWSLNAEQTAVDFGNVARDQSKTAALGKVTVVDDRAALTGWNLDASWSAFSNGTDTIPTSALTLAPKVFTGSILVDGVQLGTGARIATSSAVSTLAAGALFDADLTFKAPKDAKTGEYHSTLTLTLTSK